MNERGSRGTMPTHEQEPKQGAQEDPKERIQWSADRSQYWKSGPMGRREYRWTDDMQDVIDEIDGGKSVELLRQVPDGVLQDMIIDYAYSVDPGWVYDHGDAIITELKDRDLSIEDFLKRLGGLDFDGEVEGVEVDDFVEAFKRRWL